MNVKKKDDELIVSTTTTTATTTTTTTTSSSSSTIHDTSSCGSIKGNNDIDENDNFDIISDKENNNHNTKNDDAKEEDISMEQNDNDNDINCANIHSAKDILNIVNGTDDALETVVEEIRYLYISRSSSLKIRLLLKIIQDTYPTLKITIEKLIKKKNDTNIEKIDDLNEKNISCCSLFSFVSCRSSLELLDANGEVKEMVYYDNAIFEALISKYVSLYYNNGDNTSDIIKDNCGIGDVRIGSFINHVGLLDEVFTYSDKFTFHKRIKRHYTEVSKYIENINNNHNSMTSIIDKDNNYKINRVEVEKILLMSHLYNVRRKYRSEFIEWLNEQQLVKLIDLLKESEKYRSCFLLIEED